jgi:rare lipoprotein A (peptidoglycan hydrolase)
MNVTCPVQNQIRDDVRRQKTRTVGVSMVVGIAALFMVLSLSCRAADLASWYGEQHRGLLMANGQRFDPDRLTAASWFFELGTKVVVTHDDRSVVVEITDRGPAKRLVQDGRKIDLSRAAFAKLADPDLGLIEVSVRKY